MTFKAQMKKLCLPSSQWERIERHVTCQGEPSSCGQDYGAPKANDSGRRAGKPALGCLLAGFCVPVEPPVFRAPCCTLSAQLMLMLNQNFQLIFTLWNKFWNRKRVVLEGVRNRDSCMCCFTGCSFREGRHCPLVVHPAQYGFWSLCCILVRINFYLLPPSNSSSAMLVLYFN